MKETMQGLVDLFAKNCIDTSTLQELSSLLQSPSQWPEARKLFQKIRLKTLAAERSGNGLLEVQYLFEEVCAKTLYNLSHSPAPYDKDSSDWVVSNALALAKALGIPEAEIARLVVA